MTEMAARMRMKERGVTHRSLCCSNKNGFRREIPPLASKLNKKEQCAGPWKTKAGSFSWHAYIYKKGRGHFRSLNFQHGRQ